MRRPKLTRPTVELFPEALDVNQLNRTGAFAQPMFYPLRRMKTFPDRVEISFPKIGNYARPMLVLFIERTRMNFGGTRPWFVCACGRRCGKLYVTTIDARCRLCAELGFRCQRQDRPQRLGAKAQTIRNRLDADAFGNPIRPRKMFERTFRRYLHQLAIIQHAIETRSGIASVRYRRHRERDSSGRYCD